MIEQTFKDIYDEELAKDAIINDRMEGFRQDYLVLHCLLRKYNPKMFFECGTHMGWGTAVIKNALPESIVFSLDLPDENANKSKQHPLSEGKKGVGADCALSYIQVRADSKTFDYSAIPCDGYYVDDEHNRETVYAETKGILKAKPKIIIYHDADQPEIYVAIVDAMRYEPYDLIRVIDTRILFCLRKDI